MDFFKRTNSLDSIGVLYEEREFRSPTETPVQREHSELRVSTTVFSAPRDNVRIADHFSETSTTADTRTYSSSYPITASSLHMQHIREQSGDFTFTGQPRAVVRFRSCITANDAHGGGGGGVRADDRGGESNEGGEGDVELPAQTGPFSADILCVILLYVDVSTHADIVQLGCVSRFWRFYANLAPHWTYFRRKEWRKRADLPRYVRRIVAKTKIVTRDDYIKERVKVEDYKKKEHLIGTAKHIRWVLATGIMVGVMATANFVVAYFLGFLRTALRSDTNLGITCFVLLAVMSLLEVLMVVFPLAGSSTSDNKHSTMRILSWGLLLLVCSTVLGTITALAFTRVQAAGHVLDGPSIDFTMSAPCTRYVTKNRPSFVLLPAALSDLRWRPITFDPNETVLTPYCPRAAAGRSGMCYVLSFFDVNYTSAVFQNATALALGKDVGTPTANGFDPLSSGPQSGGLWCTSSSWPQIVAVTAKTYAAIKAARDALYPSDDDWLVAARRPGSLLNISYRCSSDINRQKTESPHKSTELWYGDNAAWEWNYVPLVTPYVQQRSTFLRVHYHFLFYAFACHIIAGVLWLVMLIAQMVFKTAANGVLGVATAAAVMCLNPLTMIVTGILCVNVSDSTFMCDASAGGCLIGGGFGLTFLVLSIYVSVRD
ncbi:hypothetical protein ABB37_07036 [Leptomonas pyrrhocoris]|uniref:F-box domain-containing protein n=1 Tax=Leptomonas pyrrhocoris TaxID=157538 RepID=A0A0N0DTN1_LEPPY|nr:hypothetical protein ABB37_07036 [Leptomonas pyrrhocoris]XP_015656154.1 hypothetical protein ABB37_07036 [Leptomonas pyrrhocoris]KPA77714.1 hypothetical protein ABB37_07036 [Leptomonas pyrrhocoris]KPA77715.1 hypothetical protein ABB37_07036 [Leptomonas pyrrhocoris]|eukprot:XP_015656153.1 hypothetical protein ABB37_07036 [Leptomonas pyrrhocoris]